MKHLFTLLLAIATLMSYGQNEKNYKKTIHMSELQDMLNDGERNNNYFRDVYFKMDRTVKYDKDGVPTIIGRDKRFYEIVYAENGMIKGIRPVSFVINNNMDISFYNCYFEDLEITDSEIYNIDFYNCVFSKWFSITNNKFFGEIIFEECEFKNDVEIIKNTFKQDLVLKDINKGGLYADKLNLIISKNNLTSVVVGGNYNTINFKRNYISGNVDFIRMNISNEINLIEDTLSIDSTQFFQANNSYESYGAYIVKIEECEIDEMNIDGNVFMFDVSPEMALNSYNYRLENSRFNELSISNEAIPRIALNNVSISNRLALDNVDLLNDFSAIDIKLPEYNIDFTWELLANKSNFLLEDSTNYRAFMVEEVGDEKLYNAYITTYKKFFSVYKNKGDLKSANACYAEMKDVETRRLKYLYDTDGTVDNYLNYQLNVFLKYFAEYGTSPIKSVKISGWVILIFAFFYFFFYSDWDQINRKFLIGKGEILLSYFKSEQKLEDLYSEQHKDDLNTFSQFKQNLKDSKAHVPFFFMLFLKPLYWIAVVKLKANKALYKRIEFLQGRWIDLSTGKKFFLGSLTFCSILTYGVYLIVIRSLNSLILSINTFTTLGFGDIPVVGVSRYVAILEGFLGWFLLSIFSVSLISQIIQN
jgi:hypothetical protein